MLGCARRRCLKWSTLGELLERPVRSYTIPGRGFGCGSCRAFFLTPPARQRSRRLRAFPPPSWRNPPIKTSHGEMSIHTLHQRPHLACGTSGGHGQSANVPIRPMAKTVLLAARPPRPPNKANPAARAIKPQRAPHPRLPHALLVQLKITLSRC